MHGSESALIILRTVSCITIFAWIWISCAILKWFILANGKKLLIRGILFMSLFSIGSAIVLGIAAFEYKSDLSYGVLTWAVLARIFLLAQVWVLYDLGRKILGH